jgi:hypothetical protein
LNDFGKESWFFHTKAGVSSTTRSSTGWNRLETRATSRLEKVKTSAGFQMR